MIGGQYPALKLTQHGFVGRLAELVRGQGRKGGGNDSTVGTDVMTVVSKRGERGHLF